MPGQDETGNKPKYGFKPILGRLMSALSVAISLIDCDFQVNFWTVAWLLERLDLYQVHFKHDFSFNGEKNLTVTKNFLVVLNNSSIQCNTFVFSYLELHSQITG